VSKAESATRRSVTLLLALSSMTEEEKDEMAKRQATPEGQEELTRIGSELQERAQHTEQPKLSTTPPDLVTYEVKIRGDGGGVKVTP
jgi:hypothetical protein